MAGRVWGVVWACALSVPVRGASVDVRYELTFPKLGVQGCTFPVTISIANRGPSLKGTLFLEDDDRAVAAPVELASGASKRMTLYLRRGQTYSDIVATLESDQGTHRAKVEAAQSLRPRETLVYVGDTTGALNSLVSDKPARPIAADSCKPENAPERTAGYDRISHVVLGDGAERLSDAAVRALHGFALSGGTLVFVGGTHTPLVNDRRWQGVCPVTDGRSVPASLPSDLAALLKAPDGAAVTRLAGRPTPGSQAHSFGGQSWVFSRRVGAGTAVLWAMDPFDTANRGWGGLRDLLLDTVPDPRQRAADKAFGQLPMDGPGPGWGRTDPFRIDLPPAEVVLGAIALYGLVVVPTVLFGLNKLGKAPWAWAALPVASLGFAGVVFAAAEGVGKASSARATSGMVYFDNGLDQGHFVGTQQVFFARSGRYDLGFRGVESCLAMDYRGYQALGKATMRGKIMDSGEVRIPDLDLPALAFREFAIRQSLTRPGEIVARALGRELEVENATPWSFESCKVQWRGRDYLVGKLEAGSRARAKPGPASEGSGRALLRGNSKDVPVGVTKLPPAQGDTGPLVVWRLDVQGAR